MYRFLEAYQEIKNPSKEIATQEQRKAIQMSPEMQEWYQEWFWILTFF